MLQKSQNLIPLQFLELKNLATTDQWCDQCKERVRCGGSDQRNGAGFNIRQQNVLLAAAEAMKLINEDNCLSSRCRQMLFSFGKQPTHIFDSGHGGIQLPKPSLCVFRDQACQRCFSGARRAVKNDGSDSISIEHAFQQAAFTQKMLLTSEFSQGPRSHSCRQRLSVLAI